MQSPNTVSPDLKKQQRRRRRRQRNRKPKNGQKEGSKKNADHKISSQQRLDLNDLTSEASALEKQLSELQTQLKINYASMPSKEQGRRANTIAAEQISATEEEINYVRSSLKTMYRQILIKDVHYASSHRIEDKLWRHIFYARIEGVRGKLRKMKPDEDPGTRQRLHKLLLHHIDTGFKFYRELNHKIRSDHHIDGKTIGVDLLRQRGSLNDEQIAMIIQSNYVSMGDLARYRASQMSRDEKCGEYWSLAKSCYYKAIDVYRSSGKPYSQLALVSFSNGSAIDVVWYYCMRDNLRSFYAKIRFSGDTSLPDEKHGTLRATTLISQFVEAFLQIHKEVLFGSGESTESFTIGPNMTIPSMLDTAVTGTILAVCNDTASPSLSKHTSSTIHILKSTLNRTISILMITVWTLGERAKDKANFQQWPHLQSLQAYLLAFTFKLLTNLYKSMQDALVTAKEKLSDEKYQSLEVLMNNALLPSLAIWCIYLSTNLAVIAQYCVGVGTDTRTVGSPRHRENWRKELVKTVQSFVSFFISHPTFPDPLNVLPITYPVSEDLLLLGLTPLAQFHATVDYFKENAYGVAEGIGEEARKQVRWGRVREFVKKIADSPSFDFVQYNQAEQNYSVIDENAKRQQQNRFMKALATQRLMEQVSSLEKNVNRMTLSGKNADEKDVPKKINVYTVLVDVTAFLDGLSRVKKWATQTLNANSRTQSSILEVVVPLEVIDSLDVHKKGTSHMNMQARESIRYLDQKLLEKHHEDKNTESPTTSFLRTQKVGEQLNDWNDAEKLWMGEETRPSLVDDLMSDDEDERAAAVDDSDADSTCSTGLFSRRRFDEDEHSLSSSEEELEEDEDEEESDDEEEQPVSFSGVPKAYRPIISCILYYQQQRRQHKDKDKPSTAVAGKPEESLILVTNDENLAWWAEMFGDPDTGRHLYVKTVDEWDHLVGTMEFDKVYTHSWKRR
ncbi:Smg-6, nonsense mediated mRNA decay factor [Apophysomyces sp. BC1015]|nr:Smg-6, nonsense mediated mRNA decay factor [Apophysomyces sp. BC1015]KAG0180337.1 Smg-6, nonsense mediated mRNA decay factor [Apophysomyces sp. BC1021]